MKILNLLVLSVLAYMAITLVSCGETGTKGGEAGSGSAAYALGYSYGVQMGQSLKNAQGLSEQEKDVDKFIEGLKVAFTGDSVALELAKTSLNERSSKAASTDPEAGGQIAYCIGVTTNIGMVAQEIPMNAGDFDFGGVKDGYTDGLTLDSFKFTKVDMDSVLKTYLQPKFDEYSAIMKTREEAKAAVAIEAGTKFLAENKEREGVITTESGLQYEIIQEGNGAKPSLTDKVKTHYHGTLIDGSIFDSSVDRGQPATFPVNGVIKGWQEGIPLMSVGAKYRFFIPQDLAYGMQAPSPKIPGGSALIFEVELIEINPAEQ